MRCGTGNNGITVALYEDAVYTGGTPVTPINRNRDSDNVSTATHIMNPSVTTTGTLLETFYVNAGSTTQAERATDEFILKSKKKYLVSITADGGSAAKFSGAMHWYEVVE
jgi:hypothetical protein